jgi:glycosyltransferase involved in cell wall biosynthesis
MFARELDGTLHCIHYLRFRSPPHAPLKYLLQSVRTLQVLFRDRPEAIHVQNPPFVSALIVHLYCRMAGARFVIEHHSAAFGSAWRWAGPAQRFIVRRAATNIVTNEHWAGVVRGWGGHGLVMYDPFLDLPEGEPYGLGPGFNVAFVGTFAPDEPVDAVVEAARMLPDIHFYVTGDTRKGSAALLAGAPPNVTFTGFLEPNGRYLGLLREVDAVMVLTTRDHTLQLAGCEAISVGKPVITSDWPYLRELFAGGAVFVHPSPESISGGVREVRDRHHELALEIEPFRRAQRQEWGARLTELKTLAAAGGRPGVRGSTERTIRTSAGSGAGRTGGGES